MDEVGRYCDFVTEGVLVPTDSVPALGVTYHVVDCWLPELLDASAAAPAQALHRLLEPVAQCAARTPHPACLTRLTCVAGLFKGLCAPGCLLCATCVLDRTLIRAEQRSDNVPGLHSEGVFEPLMAGTAAGELDLRQLDVDMLAKRLFELGERHFPGGRWSAIVSRIALPHYAGDTEYAG